MATFVDMYDYVMPEVRGVETPTVDFYIRSTVRDFLKTTTIWRELLMLPVLTGLTAYRLQPQTGGQVAGVLGVSTFDGCRLLTSIEESSQPKPGQVIDPGAPDGWWQVYPGVINFRRPPDQNYTIPIKVFKQLTLDPADTLIPDEAFDTHVEAIACGVKARLQAMNAKPWTDTTMAQVNNALYNKAKFALRSQLRDGGANGHTTVLTFRFAGR